MMPFPLAIAATLIAGALFLLYFSFEWTERSPYFLRLTKDPIMQSLLVDILPACMCICGAIALFATIGSDSPYFVGVNPLLLAALLSCLSALLFVKSIRCDLPPIPDTCFMLLSGFAALQALGLIATALLVDCWL